ncbi:hypothetical protein AXG93_1971s1070 [Marchantia polymorpha subsp. ruderalis]|uniref:Uncharacterized protein n=1 Tax=Marchantia polymorpha subsp. ruderalis TaxID=1480154 RepID=A0A176WHC1_MARPO|nr:hypothetical protein AXG93_1971s1070 [Marchantia polymorpha subsp. ruderalis]
MGLKFECPVEETCSAWALSYFFDCVCNHKDLISFSLGITSIVCWAMAEVPQILTNWQSPNTETVSMAFIFTWMIGDIFNVLGCWFNPGTLYTATTVLLVVQQLLFAWKTYKPPSNSTTTPLIPHGRSDSKSPRWPNDLDGLFPSKSAKLKSHPMNTRGYGKPPLPVTASVPVRGNMGSPGSYRSWGRLTLSNSYGTDSSPLAKGIVFSSVAVVTLTFSGGFSSLGGGGGGSYAGSSRRLLQGEFPAEDHDIVSSLGLILGWLMTCIYLTGRLPQIILNWSRDFVIGVSMSTVIFAFLGNATYLGSLLVRGVEWQRLKFVLPWVVDIAFCLFMDFFILQMMCQYLYHQRRDDFPTLE